MCLLKLCLLAFRTIGMFRKVCHQVLNRHWIRQLANSHLFHGIGRVIDSSLGLLFHSRLAIPQDSGDARRLAQRSVPVEVFWRVFDKNVFDDFSSVRVSGHTSSDQVPIWTTGFRNTELFGIRVCPRPLLLSRFCQRDLRILMAFGY